MTDSEFDQDAFDQAFADSVAQCTELTAQDAAHFVEHGYVVVKRAFSKDIARAVCEQAWRELETDFDVDRDQPSSWYQPFMGPEGAKGYVRTKGSDQRFRLNQFAPRAFASQADLIGGTQRLPKRGETLAWRDNAIGNFGHPDVPWTAPDPRQHGWHKDGWHFRHFLG